MPIKPRETPIERIFRKVMGWEMPLGIQAVLLHKSSTESGDDPGVLDYPGSMSQWEKDSPVAEARLSSARKRRRSSIGGFRTQRDGKPW
jgi:hypothetical protein